MYQTLICDMKGFRRPNHERWRANKKQPMYRFFVWSATSGETNSLALLFLCQTINTLINNHSIWVGMCLWNWKRRGITVIGLSCCLRFDELSPQLRNCKSFRIDLDQLEFTSTILFQLNESDEWINGNAYRVLIFIDVDRLHCSGRMRAFVNLDILLLWNG